VGQAPLDVRFGHGRILQPDVFVLFDRIPFDHEGPLDRVPELCIEVRSSRPSYDRLTKRTIYADAGVRELWTVEPGYSLNVGVAMVCARDNNSKSRSRHHCCRHCE
jgi:Uma2 family endonuclease